MLTGVKRLASDNTAVSGTPSPDNYITLVLHCFHSLLVILLKSQWLESQWQRDKWRWGSRRWNPALSTLDWMFWSALSFCPPWSCRGTQVLKCTFFLKCRYSLLVPIKEYVHFLFAVYGRCEGPAKCLFFVNLKADTWSQDTMAAPPLSKKKRKKKRWLSFSLLVYKHQGLVINLLCCPLVAICWHSMQTILLNQDSDCWFAFSSAKICRKLV